MWGCCRLAVVLISARNRCGAEDGRQLRPEHLERDLAVVAEVVREVDRGHAALPQLALEAVAVGESGRQVPEVFGQVCSGVGSRAELGVLREVARTEIAY